MESGTKMMAAGYNDEMLRLSSDQIMRTTSQCTHVLVINPHYQIVHGLNSTFSELWKEQFWELNTVLL